MTPPIVGLSVEWWQLQMTRDMSLVARAEAFVNVPVTLSHMAIIYQRPVKKREITISDSTTVVPSSLSLNTERL
jgi:hypothetical protein